MSKALVFLSLLGTGGLTWLFWPGTANANPLQGTATGGKKRTPRTVAEAVAFAQDPAEKDAEYVHLLAVWLLNHNAKQEAAKAESRAVSLRAERVLGHGLAMATTMNEVAADVRTLQGFDSYQQVLIGRLEVEQGRPAPPPFALQLNSGGSLTIDLSIYAAGSSGAAPGAPAASSPSSGASSAGSAAPGSLAAEETKPENDRAGTIALARLLLSAQSKPGWKHESEDVRIWQAKVGQKSDGKFGPTSALAMAREVGQLPWVRYFALGVGNGSKAASVDAYRAQLRALAASLGATRPEHAAALRLSAERERGQGWPTKPSAAAAVPFTPEQIDQYIRGAS